MILLSLYSLLFSRKMKNYWHTWLSEKIALRSCIWTCLSSIFRRPFLTACTEVGRTRPCLTFLYVFSSILSFLQTWFTVDVTLCSKVKGLWAEKRTEFYLLEIDLHCVLTKKKLRENWLPVRKTTSGSGTHDLVIKLVKSLQLINFLSRIFWLAFSSIFARKRA